jgi:hypothetical protein
LLGYTGTVFVDKTLGVIAYTGKKRAASCGIIRHGPRWQSS